MKTIFKYKTFVIQENIQDLEHSDPQTLKWAQKNSVQNIKHATKFFCSSALKHEV